MKLEVARPRISSEKDRREDLKFIFEGLKQSHAGEIIPKMDACKDSTIKNDTVDASKFSNKAKEESLTGKLPITNQKLKNNKITLSYTERINGYIFKEKQREFRDDEPIHVQDLEEYGINNMGVILDLDDTVALTKIKMSGGEAHLGAGKVNPVPSGAVGWISAGLGGFLTVAGMYFGTVNFWRAGKSLKKLEPVIKKNKEYVENLKKEKNITNTEIENMETYSKTLDTSVKENKFQKWISGATAFGGGAAMFSSLALHLLTLPGLAIMTIFAGGNLVKNVSELRKENKINLTKLDKIDSEYGKQGRKVFESRLNDKKAFHKTMIPAWLTFGGSTGVILASTALGFAGIVFPFPVMIAVAMFLLLSVFTIMYKSIKTESIVTTKNENRINRRYLGNEENILWRIALDKKKMDLIKDFENKLEKNYRKQNPMGKLSQVLKNTGNYALKVLTLGIPKQLETFDIKIRNRYFSDLESPKLAEISRGARDEYFINNLDEQIKYLEFIKNNLSKLDISLFRFYLKNNGINEDINKEASTKLTYKLESQIKNKMALKNKFNIQKNSMDEAVNFELEWEYMLSNNIVIPVLEQVSDNLLRKDDKKKLNNHLYDYIKEGYLSIEKTKENGENKISFDKDTLIKGIKEGNENAKELLNLINMKLDKTIIDELYEADDYKYDELCDHLEEKLRQK